MYKLLLPAALLLCGCGAMYQVVDIHGKEINVKDAQLEGQNTVLVLFGKSVQEVRLESVITLNLYDAAVVYKDDKVFYQASLILKNGNEMKSDRPAKGDPVVYVSIDNSIRGKTGHGTVAVPFREIREIRQVDVQ